MNKKTAINVIFGLLGLLLVVGLATQFMPSGPQSIVNVLKQEQGKPAIRVNGEPITAEYLEKIVENNPSPFEAQGGVLQDDFRTYIISQVIQQELLRQAAADIDVSRADVDAEVQTVREQQGLTDDAAWTDALQRVGLSDSEYRKQVRDGLAVQRKIDQIKAEAQPATPEEVQLYYDLNPTLFQTEPRIKGRQIVVDDRAKAEELLAKVQAGGDFATLATEYSTVNAENGGALGALGEGGTLQAVEPVVLPTAVAQAAMALGGAGTTGVVESGGQFYIVDVEELLQPEVKPFEEVKDEIQTTLDERKKAAVVEDWLTAQTEAAQVEVVDDAWAYHNPTVAEVAGKKIPYSEVVGRVLQNQQLMAMMQSMDGEQLAELVNGMLKPSVTDEVIQAYAAPEIVKENSIPLVGTRDDLLMGLVAYGGRDASVSEAELQAAYEDRIAQFETPASATISEATFDTREQALAFRQDWTGGDFTKAATEAGAIVSERGQVGPADGVLDPSLAQAVFEGPLREVGAGASLSDIVETANGWKVAYVTDLQPAEVQPLDAVRATLRDALLNEKQAELGRQYLAEQVQALNPTNNLDEVLAAQQARVGAAAKADTPAEEGAGVVPEGETEGGAVEETPTSTEAEPTPDSAPDSESGGEPEKEATPVEEVAQ